MIFLLRLTKHFEIDPSGYKLKNYRPLIQLNVQRSHSYFPVRKVSVDRSLMLQLSSDLMKSTAGLHINSGNKIGKSISVHKGNSAQITTEDEIVIPTVSFHKHN